MKFDHTLPYIPYDHLKAIFLNNASISINDFGKIMTNFVSNYCLSFLRFPIDLKLKIVLPFHTLQCRLTEQRMWPHNSSLCQQLVDHSKFGQIL